MSAGTLLVVDDNKTNRDVLSRRLSREGYTVVCAEGGREALESLRAHAIDLVLLDLVMPEMGGIEVLEEVRKTRGQLELPILMTSATNDTPQMVSALDLGANDFLTKPLNFELMLAKVRRHLAVRPRASQEATLLEQSGEYLAHYRLEGLLGEGDMGRVWQAIDTRLLRPVAVKIMRPETGDESSPTLKKFLQEARAVARVSHPGVVTIHDVGLTPVCYLVMEMVEGDILENKTLGLAVANERASDWMLQILDGLQAVHDGGIVHGDLKPANIMVTPDGRIKVMDFGLAEIRGSELRIADPDGVWGTPQFMSPEHVDPQYGDVDAQSDLFAASHIFYELLTGGAAFHGETQKDMLYHILTSDPRPPHLCKPSVCPELSRICMRGLEKLKSNRYPDCSSMAADIRARGTHV